MYNLIIYPLDSHNSDPYDILYWHDLLSHGLIIYALLDKTEWNLHMYI